ncbi:c-type cytochrome [Benzoatithermus flavus]|uniref:Cytochrome c n=1 Tax=Benzoatithermus flavus TaxID=3108223 RepID=A0ABU8XYB6_9PROT
MASTGAKAGVLLTAILAAATAAATEALTNPVLGDPSAIAEGRKIYRQRCYICHLSHGGRGPNLFATQLSDEAFLMTVINGRKGAIMPAFGLQMSPDEVWQVHAYVKSTDHYE